MDGNELRAHLAHCTGSEKMYFHSLNRSIHYSEGVREFAQKAGGGAYWLLDILATEPKILKQGADFACIVLDVREGGAVLTVDDGNDNVKFRRVISFTDCPEGKWKFYMEGNVIMLPHER